MSNNIPWKTKILFALCYFVLPILSYYFLEGEESITIFLTAYLLNVWLNPLLLLFIGLVEKEKGGTGLGYIVLCHFVVDFLMLPVTSILNPHPWIAYLLLVADSILYIWMIKSNVK